MGLLDRLREHDAGVDFSTGLREDTSWRPGTLNHRLTSPTAGSVSAISVDPVLGLLAIGTTAGKIIICGAPPVNVVLDVPRGNGRASAEGIKSVAFVTPIKRLVCVDNGNVLHVWDLDPHADLPTPPIHLASFPCPDEVTVATTNPGHSHIFIGLRSGETITYDADRLCPSPYVIHNLWLEHEDRLRKTGVLPPEQDDAFVSTVLDIAVHPRNQGQLFIAYEGGVVLWNIGTKTALHTYQLLLHPGATGGGAYRPEELYTERYPPVTALSLHPSGHILCIGHLDGCLSFWAVEDSDRPVAVRTLAQPFSFIDAHIPDPMSLMDEPEDATPREPPASREPIFKLAWNGYPSSTGNDDQGALTPTTLTIMGGTASREPVGLTVLRFPGLCLPTPEIAVSSSPNASMRLPPSTRQALKSSLFPPEDEPSDQPPRTTLNSPNFIEDFLLVPRASPWYGGSFDPEGILLLTSEGDRSKAVLEAYEFPPTNSTRRIRLPGQLGFAYAATKDFISTALLRTFESRDAFGRLLSDFVNSGDQKDSFTGPRIPSLRGGSAFSNFNGDDAPDPRLSKFDYQRIMILGHKDGTIRFYDLSSQLLLQSGSPLRFEYPQILPHLTIETSRIPSKLLTPLSSPSPNDDQSLLPSRPGVVSLYFSTVTLDCLSALDSEDMLIYKFKDRNEDVTPCYLDTADKDVFIPLQHLSLKQATHFYPFCLIKPMHGAITACALSDGGFVALAYGQGDLRVVDLRGPQTVYKYEANDKDKRGPVFSMKWAVCGLGNDFQSRLRLLASYKNGDTHIFTFMLGPDGQRWKLSVPKGKEDFISISNSAIGDPVLSVVLDRKSGNECAVTSSTLSKAMHDSAGDEPKQPKGSKDTIHSFWVTAGKHGARCFENITGGRLGSVEWPKDAAEVVSAVVIQRTGIQALVTYHADNKASVYSIPDLDPLQSLSLPLVSGSDPFIASSETDGDYLILSDVDTHPQLTYATLFNFHRPLPSLIDCGEPSPASMDAFPVPPPIDLVPPTTATGMLGAWIWGTGLKVLKGAEVDAALAGPDRPLPRPTLQKPKPSSGTTTAVQRKGIAPAASRVSVDGRGDLFSRLKAAAAERGEALGQVEETFSSLESSSRDLVGQAKRLAATETTKRWLPWS